MYVKIVYIENDGESTEGNSKEKLSKQITIEKEEKKKESYKKQFKMNMMREMFLQIEKREITNQKESNDFLKVFLNPKILKNTIQKINCHILI